MIGLLSGAVIATIISAVVSSLVTLHVTERNYRNLYFKKIVDKRFKALESINNIINKLKIAIPDTDERCYHNIFGWSKEEYALFVLEFANEEMGFWLTNETRSALLRLNKEFYRCHLLLDEMNDNLVEVGKNEYMEIGKLRDDLEHCMLSELPSLYKVNEFIKNKSVIKEYGKYNLWRRPSDGEI